MLRRTVTSGFFRKGHNKANIGLGVGGIIGKKKSAESFLDDFMKEHYPNAPVLTKIAGGVPCADNLKKLQLWELCLSVMLHDK